MRIENFRDGPQGGNIVATFDIDLEDSWGTIYHEWRLIKRTKGGVFVGSPSYSTSDPITGLKKYFPYIEMKPEKKREFESELMKLLSEYTNI